jgi:bifunctional DNA-binding transcriptional regulator/antitoxin component of YhaV-PrlF toxin-antitoxin module
VRGFPISRILLFARAFFRLALAKRRGWRTVSVEHLFSGSAVDAVGFDGAVRLPPFILRVVEGGAGLGRMMVGAHESHPCLTAWEPRRAPVLQAEVERQRLRDEANGVPVAEHHQRARRVFGFVEDAIIEGGRITIPAMLRRKAGIGDRVLFVGTGSGFEIWNPDLARRAGDPALREIAEYRLGINEDMEEGEAK